MTGRDPLFLRDEKLLRAFAEWALTPSGRTMAAFAKKPHGKRAAHDQVRAFLAAMFPEEECRRCGHDRP